LPLSCVCTINCGGFRIEKVIICYAYNGKADYVPLQLIKGIGAAGPDTDLESPATRENAISC